MNKRIVYIGLYIAAGFVFGFAAKSLLPGSSMQVEAAENPVSEVKGKESLRKEKDKVAALEAELASCKKTIAELRNTTPDLPATENRVTPVKVKSDRVKNGDLAKLIGDLVGKGMVSQKKRPAPSTREKYAPFIDALGMNAEETDAFLALIGGSNAFLPAEMRSYDEEKLKALLGEDGFKMFKEYEHELPARMFADDFAAELAEAGLALSDDQYQDFLKLDPSIVEGIPLSYSPMTITLKSDEGEDVSKMVDGAVGKAVDNFSATVDQAGKILNENQMAVFDKYMGERLEQKESAAATAEAILPGILNPEMIKSLGGNVGVQSSVTIISDEMTVEEPVGAP